MQDSIHVRPAVICYGGVGNVVHCVVSFTDWSGGCLDKTPVQDDKCQTVWKFDP